MIIKIKEEIMPPISVMNVLIIDNIKPEIKTIKSIFGNFTLSFSIFEALLKGSADRMNKRILINMLVICMLIYLLRPKDL